MKYVGAARPVAPWLGGKSKLAKTLIERIEAIPHEAYAEPFVGMGGVFLRRGYRPKSEIINDLNSEIINLFRILQRHYPQFMDCLKYQITSRREFERLRAIDPATLTDLERAGRFLYLQRLAFGGQINGVFGVAKERAARFDINRLGPILEEAHERLAGVVFENLPWHEFITRYDSPKTLFYLDPPYFGGEKDYGRDIFAPEDFQKIADTMVALKGKFILSINDTPEIREIFGRFKLDEVRVTYTIAKGEASGKARELIFSNASVVAGLI
jgi:DNA adenine methylase